MMELRDNGSAPVEHLAIIMDGNGRWAQRRGLPRVAGHNQGGHAVTQVVDECLRLGIRYLSLFAFSSENWGRPREEVNALMALLLQYLDGQRRKMLDQGVRLRVIGDRSRLEDSVNSALTRAEAETAQGSRLDLVLALSYGGRDELIRAAQRFAEKVTSGALSVDRLDEESFTDCLDSAGIPDPDLLIRTSGEKRISNFLLWQIAYTELYFTDVLWPDFDAGELQKALGDYCQRKRRFGLTDSQLGEAAVDV